MWARMLQLLERRGARMPGAGNVYIIPNRGMHDPTFPSQHYKEGYLRAVKVLDQSRPGWRDRVGYNGIPWWEKHGRG